MLKKHGHNVSWEKQIEIIGQPLRVSNIEEILHFLKTVPAKSLKEFAQWKAAHVSAAAVDRLAWDGRWLKARPSKAICRSLNKPSSGVFPHRPENLPKPTTRSRALFLQWIAPCRFRSHATRISRHLGSIETRESDGNSVFVWLFNHYLKIIYVNVNVIMQQ